MKCIIRIFGLPDELAEGEFEDIVLVGALAASKKCNKDNREVKFYILEKCGVMMYRNFVSYTHE